MTNNTFKKRKFTPVCFHHEVCRFSGVKYDVTDTGAHSHSESCQTSEPQHWCSFVCSQHYMQSWIPATHTHTRMSRQERLIIKTHTSSAVWLLTCSRVSDLSYLLTSDISTVTQICKQTGAILDHNLRLTLTQTLKGHFGFCHVLIDNIFPLNQSTPL